MKKVLSVILSLVMVLSVGICAFATDADVDYTITSTYEDVDFGAYEQYKTDLHSHTNASDGDNTLQEMVEKHYEEGFDILAISDHGTVSYSWTKPNYDPTIKLVMMVKEGVSPIFAFDATGTALNGKTYAVETVNGDEFYSQDGGDTMLRVPYANEQNPTSFNNAHVNTWFADYGHGRIGGTSDYATPISAIDSLGGLSVINHPGEYTNARDEETTADAYNKDNITYKYYIDKFENMLVNYDSCLGIDINSKGDSRTRFDRKLWDILLTDLAPSGRNVYAIASSDAHNLDIVNSGYVMAVMPEKTSAALKDCLADGEFFAQSRYLGNIDELFAYAQGLIATGDATAVALGEAFKANAEIEEKYEFAEDAAATVITGVNVDNDADTITLEGENMLYVRWISDGKVVAEGTTIDLDECENIGSYVRAEIISEGAVTYTQAFLLDYEGMPEAKINENFKDTDTAIFAGIDAFLRALGTALEGVANMLLPLLGVVN